MANEAYRPTTAQDLIKMYNLDSLSTDRKKTKASAEKIKVLEETSNTLKEFAEEVEKQIEDLEKIADGKITTYYYSGVPTLTNFPANEWTVEEYENHIGDMYYDKETGNAYKFLYDNETREYLWKQEINAELSEALARANAAQETADRKKQIFVDTPYPPYQIGDLWLKDDKVIYRCRAEKESGSYNENDWKVATDFTNDDYAKNVEEQFNQFKVTVEKDYATKVLLETTKDEIKTSVEGLTTKTETLEDELGNKADVLKVTELTQKVDTLQTTTEFNVTAIEKLEVNDIEQTEKIAEFEVTVGGVSSTIENQNNQISKVVQTVEELNSKISDIADITISAEKNDAQVELAKINESEPIRVVIRPIEENISYLYPHDNLYPSDTLYLKNRMIRFLNLTTQEVFDYELPIDLLYHDNINYDEFLLDYDGQSCVVNKRVGYNSDGTTYVLDKETTMKFPYPKIELTNGDYQISLPGYDRAYLFVRLMTQNIYTTQFTTKAEVNSEINQTAQSINLSVDKKLESYSTTSEMNAQIKISENTINQSVSQKVGKDEIISSINQTAESVKILANKLGLTANDVLNIIAGNEINLTSKNLTIKSNNFSVDKNGNMVCTNAKVTGEINSTTGNIGGWNLSGTGLSNGSYYIRKNGYSNIYVISDIIICQMMITGTIQKPEAGTPLFKHYDVNNDGVINLQDYVLIQSMILEIN